MATILRVPGERYTARYDKVPLEQIANSVRHLPAAWIAPGGVDVTDDFVRYARPLIGEAMAPLQLVNGVPRFARCDVRFVGKKLAAYVPVRCR
jgi:6-phosphofructokinase 1